MRRFTIVTVALSSAVSFLVGVILAGGGTTVGSVGVPPPALKVQRDHALPVTATAGTAVNFADVAERINPAVVNIDAASRAGHGRHGRGDDPPDTPRDFDVPHQGSGSGFIIDPDGSSPRTAGNDTHRSIGLGKSSGTVRRGPCAGPTFHSRVPGIGVIQRLGSSRSSRCKRSSQIPSRDS